MLQIKELKLRNEIYKRLINLSERIIPKCTWKTSESICERDAFPNLKESFQKWNGQTAVRRCLARREMRRKSTTRADDSFDVFATCPRVMLKILRETKYVDSRTSVSE